LTATLSLRPRRRSCFRETAPNTRLLAGLKRHRSTGTADEDSERRRCASSDGYGMELAAG